MLQPIGKLMSMPCSEDVDHASDKLTRQYQTGIFILCNRAPVMWMSKKHNSVETSTFGSKFTALKLIVELVISFWYKLRMFGVQPEGSTDMFCDNKAVFNNTSTPESVLRNKNHRIEYHKCREAVAVPICRIAKEDTNTNLADLFTNILGRTKRQWLLNLFNYWEYTWEKEQVRESIEGK